MNTTLAITDLFNQIIFKKSPFTSLDCQDVNLTKQWWVYYLLKNYVSRVVFLLHFRFWILFNENLCWATRIIYYIFIFVYSWILTRPPNLCRSSIPELTDIFPQQIFNWFIQLGWKTIHCSPFLKRLLTHNLSNQQQISKYLFLHLLTLFAKD